MMENSRIKRRNRLLSVLLSLCLTLAAMVPMSVPVFAGVPVESQNLQTRRVTLSSNMYSGGTLFINVKVEYTDTKDRDESDLCILQKGGDGHHVGLEIKEGYTTLEFDTKQPGHGMTKNGGVVTIEGTYDNNNNPKLSANETFFVTVFADGESGLEYSRPVEVKIPENGKEFVWTKPSSGGTTSDNFSYAAPSLNKLSYDNETKTLTAEFESEDLENTSYTVELLTEKESIPDPKGTETLPPFGDKTTSSNMIIIGTAKASSTDQEHVKIDVDSHKVEMTQVVDFGNNDPAGETLFVVAKTTNSKGLSNVKELTIPKKDTKTEDMSQNKLTGYIEGQKIESDDGNSYQVSYYEEVPFFGKGFKKKDLESVLGKIRVSANIGGLDYVFKVTNAKLIRMKNADSASDNASIQITKIEGEGGPVDKKATKTALKAMKKATKPPKGGLGALKTHIYPLNLTNGVPGDKKTVENVTVSGKKVKGAYKVKMKIVSNPSKLFSFSSKSKDSFGVPYKIELVKDKGLTVESGDVKGFVGKDNLTDNTK